MISRWVMLTLFPLFIAALMCACTSCNGDGDATNGMDGSPDTDSDADSDIDTSWDGGPLTDCVGGPYPGEVCIRGGTYLMGCMPYDTWCDDDEKPMVEVTLSPFWIDEKEATYVDVLVWMNSVGDDHIKEERFLRDPEGNILFSTFSFTSPPICYDTDAGAYEFDYACEYGCGGPVEAAAGGFSWLGAKRYCEHWGKRLPTEAEWEAAARGQTKLIWPCDWEHKPCWHGKYAKCFEGDECYNEVCCSPVEDDSMAECNSLDGVRGMYGNANEYVLDGLDSNHSWCADGCTDPPPRPVNEQGEHVSKGGGISNDATRTRISARVKFGQSMENGGSPVAGTRCVRSPISFEDPDAGPDGGSDAGPDGGSDAGPDGGK